MGNEHLCGVYVIELWPLGFFCGVMKLLMDLKTCTQHILDARWLSIRVSRNSIPLTEAELIGCLILAKNLEMEEEEDERE